MKVTFSVIKADVGSIGGHTKPSEQMLQTIRETVQAACSGKKRLLIDGLVTYTGDDIALIMSHQHGVGAEVVHKFAWDCFLTATDVAKKQGLYGAGQDLLVDAPSGNIRGAGPAVAEIEFDRDPASRDRPAEAMLVFAADKCGPGAYNYPLYTVFCDPMHNGGLLLNPKMHRGFTLTIIDMDYKDGDRLIKLDVPERVWDVAALLQNPDRFAVEAIHSRYKPDEQIVSVSATRLHNIAGKYTGKDDPVAIVRTQGIFPAPEEAVEPYMLGHYVAGDCRGSHVMPIMPVAINTPVAGAFCLPLVSCLAFSMDEAGQFSGETVDLFGSGVWEQTRLKVQAKADEWRRQGFIGPTMASHTELAYTGIVDTLQALDKEFVVKED
jgi:fructose 1,6-bisphosphate aldolase/phosphatase